MRREFTARTKVAAYERSKGFCEQCGGPLRVGRIAYDHRIPDALGGEPTLENCQVLCAGPGSCHAQKTAGEDVPAISRAKRREASHLGARVSRNPMPFGRKSRLKRKINGQVVER